MKTLIAVVISLLFMVESRDSITKSYIEIDLEKSNVKTKNFDHSSFRNTGWCPPGNKSGIEEYAMSESSWQNHAFIRASQGIDLVRIHDLLYLITNSNEYEKLDRVLDMIVKDHDLRIGFELMGNPDLKRFDSFRNETQILMWKSMVSDLASHVVQRYGLDTVRTWRFESWNEPDHVCNPTDRLAANITCDLTSWLSYFYDACLGGLRSVDSQLVFGGPGTGGDTLNSPFLVEMLRHENISDIDFIQWHKKGVLPLVDKVSNTAFDVNVTDVVLKNSFGRVYDIGNEEADPSGDWAAVYDWRQDATYPAAVVRVLNMHLHSIVDEIDGVNWSYHANDNAFLNYGDQWFSQRTLVARFMMNESVSRFGKKGDVVEVIRKPILNLMRMLNFLGNERVLNVNEMLNVSKDLEPMIGTDPSETTLGTIVTTRQNSLRKEFSILLYDSNGTNADNSINRTIDVKLNGVENESAIRHYVIDQHSGNPARLWRDEMNSVKYPTPEQFQVLREESELAVVSKTKIVDDGLFMTTLRLTQPSVHLLHVCGSAGDVSRLQVKRLRARVTPTKSPPTVFLRWDQVDERCIETYEVYWNGEKLNDVMLLHSMYVHAQGGDSASGCYRVRAVDYWMRRGEFSDKICV